MKEQLRLQKLLEQAQEGVREAERELIITNAPLVDMIVRRENLFASGHTVDDIMQHGYIGLLKAIRTYQPTHNTHFKTYASTCIRNEMLSLVRSSHSQRRRAMDRYISLEDEIDGVQIELADERPSPEEELLAREYSKRMSEFAEQELSALEQSILTRFSAGYSYEEIAFQLNVPPKSIDNGLQRIRAKMRKMLRDS